MDSVRTLQTVLLSLTALWLLGCSSTTTQSFNVPKNSNVESSRIAVDADFGNYDRLTAQDMGIYFPANAAPSIEDQQRIRQIFREAFISELSDYQIVETKGPSTLEVQATLIDLRQANAGDVPNLGREVRDMSQPGTLVFLMELKDSVSGKILARAADSTGNPSFSTSAETATDWGTVETAAARWAELFRQFLDENLNK